MGSISAFASAADDIRKEARLNAVVDELKFEDVYDDLDRAVRATVRSYVDDSCYALNETDLVGEVMAKVWKACCPDGANYLRRLPRGPLTRANFFKAIKTVMNNQVRALVQRHRFTYKRTGQQAPSREDCKAQNEAYWAHTKRVDVSLDDPENAVQVQGESEVPLLHEMTEEVRADFAKQLLPVEKVVFETLWSLFNQTSTISVEAHWHAHIESMRGRKPGSEHVEEITLAHVAAGVGLDAKAFNTIHSNLKRKVLSFMDQLKNDPHNDRRAVLDRLEEILDFQIPSTVDPLVQRRMLTLVARERHASLDDEAKRLLKAAGARLPDFTANSELHCFGALYVKNHKACSSCALHDACATECSNVGLGEVTLSAKTILKQIRIPVLAQVDAPKPKDEAVEESAPVTTTVNRLSPVEALPDISETDESEVTEDGVAAALLAITARPAAIALEAPSPAAKPKKEKVAKRPVEDKQLARPDAGAYGTMEEVTTESTLRADELVSYLHTHFKYVLYKGQDYFKLNVKFANGRSIHPFLVHNKENRFWFRFCNPTERIAKQLIRVGQSYYLPTAMSVKDTIALVTEHTNDVMQANMPLAKEKA